MFCEGKTEEEYIKLLRQHFRKPITIKSYTDGNRISARRINAVFPPEERSEKDRIFFLYDCDDGLLAKLQAQKGTLLVSNPCIELWFLLHYQPVQANLSCDDCKNQLLHHRPEYKKGVLSPQLQQDLIQYRQSACERARTLQHHHNPSSTIYRLIELWED